MGVVVYAALTALRVTLQHHPSVNCRGTPFTLTVLLRRYAGAGCLLTGAM